MIPKNYCDKFVDTIEVILGEWRDTEYKYVGTQELLMKLKVKTQLPLQHQVAKLVTNPHLIERKKASEEICGHLIFRKYWPQPKI